MRGLLYSVLAAICCLLGAVGWLAVYALRPGPPADESTAVVFIERGSSVTRIGNLLADAGLIRQDRRFVLLTALTGYSSRLPAGEFQLATGSRPLDLIKELAAARPVEHALTIPEGRNLEQIADLFAAGGWVDRERFIELAHDPALVAQFGLDEASSLEGYLFPDTYRLIRPPPDERELLARLVERALRVWESLADTELSLSRHEAFTLASIVEKETGAAVERPLIAGVFFNRLARNMRLQSDPTVVYGLPGPIQRLTRDHLRTPTPYNTYVISGLPPGPICSPGRAALQAVVEPEQTEYLYFVSKNDGTHHFSRTLREHNRAVQTYQR